MYQEPMLSPYAKIFNKCTSLFGFRIAPERNYNSVEYFHSVPTEIMVIVIFLLENVIFPLYFTRNCLLYLSEISKQYGVEMLFL